MRLRSVASSMFLFMAANTFADGILADQLEIEMSTINSQKCTVVIGASYALGWGEPEAEGWTFINRGVSGDETSGMLGRFEKDVLSETPDAVLIWGFINDIFRSERSLMEEKLVQSKQNLTEMIRIARGAGIQPILATEVTVRHEKSLVSEIQHLAGRLLGKESYQGYVNRHVHDLNDWMRGIATDEGIPLLDFAQVLSDSDGYRIRSYATDDGSHISEQGYNALSIYLTDRLAEVAVPGNASGSCAAVDIDHKQASISE